MVAAQKAVAPNVAAHAEHAAADARAAAAVAAADVPSAAAVHALVGLCGLHTNVILIAARCLPRAWLLAAVVPCEYEKRPTLKPLSQAIVRGASYWPSS